MFPLLKDKSFAFEKEMSQSERGRCPNSLTFTSKKKNRDKKTLQSIVCVMGCAHSGPNYHFYISTLVRFFPTSAWLELDQDNL